VTLVEAGRELKRHPATLRRWIRQGAPTLELGSAGRGRGSTVDPAALERWRLLSLTQEAGQRDDQAVLELIATGLWDTFRRDEAHLRVDLDARRAAGLLAMAYERCWMNLTRRSRDELVLPPEIERLCAVFVE
jgi:hypothetical protein